ncbi:hypothetical protein WSM22_24260 [Cytophagales bacterium WSM2-2]|nr:hypothetical protein WSM22_24260 [Cytophagales bacterium WSM2-2]
MRLLIISIYLILGLACTIASAQSKTDSVKIKELSVKKDAIAHWISSLSQVSYQERHELYKKGVIVRYVKTNKGATVEQEIEKSHDPEHYVLLYKDEAGRVLYTEESTCYEKTKWSLYLRHYFTTEGKTFLFEMTGVQSLGGDNFDEGSLVSYYDDSLKLLHSGKKCTGQSMTCAGFDQLPFAPSLTLKDFLQKKKIKY